MRGWRRWRGLAVLMVLIIMVYIPNLLLSTQEQYITNQRDILHQVRDVPECGPEVILNLTGRSADVNILNVSTFNIEDISLKPGQSRVVGVQRPYRGFLTIGIPSVKRSNGVTYLLKCLSSIIDNTSLQEKTEVVVVIFLADFDTKYNADVVEILNGKFTYYIETGFIQIVQVSRDFYPQLENLKQNFHDAPERVIWRSKQVVDFSFMFLYSQNISDYYIQIEDDVICASNFVNDIMEYIRGKNHGDWAILEFSELGFIGKLFKSSDLYKLAMYMLTFYQEQPVDWLMLYFRLAMAQQQVHLRKPTLFQHMGINSSLDTKESILQDRYFDSSSKLWESDDPPGYVISNMEPFGQWFPKLAYGSNNGFFWAKDPKKDDWVILSFSNPIKLKRVIIETGNPLTKRDTLINGSLEWSPGDEVTRTPCTTMHHLGEFSDGRIDMSDLESDYSPLRGSSVYCLKITVVCDHDKWIYLNQIAVFIDDR